MVRASLCGQALLLDVYGKATAMLSNVPGPASEAHFCGQPLRDLMFYAFAPLGVYIGVLSYNGRVSTGVCCVPECEPDASRLARFWKPSVDELLEAAARRTRRIHGEQPKDSDAVPNVNPSAALKA
jgi:hypothetical protein